MRVPRISAGPALAIGLAFAALGGKALAQNPEFPLWPNGAPLADGKISTGAAATDKPSIMPYPADKPNGAAVVVFPGGAYGALASDKEGWFPAKWFSTQGIAAFAVRYRYAPYHHPVEMWDAQRAIRWVRAHAKEYGIDTARVGVLGFSAGGHLASTVSTHYDGGNPSAADSIDRQGCKPAFSLLGYPVITMDRAFTHAQSRDNLLGTTPSQALVDSLSSEKQVDPKTPPAFLFHATDDGVVPIRNPQSYYDSCQKKGVPAAFMKFDHGGHGFGLADGKAGSPNDPVLHAWCDSSVKWLDKLGLLAPKAVSLAPAAGRSGSQAPVPGVGLSGRDGRASDALGRRARNANVPARHPASGERASGTRR